MIRKCKNCTEPMSNRGIASDGSTCWACPNCGKREWVGGKQKRYRYTQMRQVGGDDGYQWTVFVKGPDGVFREKVNGCVRREAQYYRDKFEKEETEKRK